MRVFSKALHSLSGTNSSGWVDKMTDDIAVFKVLLWNRH